VANLLKIIEDHSDTSSANLSVIEFDKLPWQPKRIYWLSNFVDESTRGNHAHRELSQIFIALSGTLDLEVFHGLSKEVFHLSPNGPEVHLSPGTWRVISKASADAILMVLADSTYDESDYIRDWDEYLEWFTGSNLNEE